MHESISDAIREVADEFPGDSAAILEVRYVGVSIGTQLRTKMPTESHVPGVSLVDFTAAAWRSDGETWVA